MSTLRKQCSDCLDYKPLQSFWYGPRYLFDRNYRCRECWRKKRIADAIYQRDKLCALIHYGRVCAVCGESDKHRLQIDHVNNDGKQHREAETGARTIYQWLRTHDYPAGFQVLCGPCNIKKYHEFRRAVEVGSDNEWL